MSYERAQAHRWDCDGDGCHANYEVDLDNSFQQGFAEAKGDGWVANVEYIGNISTWKHYCKTCKKKLGD